MAPLAQTRSSSLGLPSDSYIYKIISTAQRHDPLTYTNSDQLAIISSDDSLRFVDPSSLDLVPDGVVKNVNDSVTCLERVDDSASHLVATAGRDGFIRLWDKRSKQRALEIRAPQNLISSLVCYTPKNFIAAGIENPNDGPGESPVYIWDQRNPRQARLELVESHTDTVTSLQLHPDMPTLLLSASTDGLINIFNTSKSDEEEALYQVINHRSAVAHAGFMYPSTDIYALGTDETMSFYALQSQQEDEEEPTPKAFGDVREQLSCEYVAKLHWVGDEAFVAAGKHSEGYLDLVPLEYRPQDGLLQYVYDTEKSIRLPNAHGTEIVRDIFTDVHSQTTYTCGEDGYIRAWKLPESGEIMDVDNAAEPSLKTLTDPKNRKEKRKEKRENRHGGAVEDGRVARYKPY